MVAILDFQTLLKPITAKSVVGKNLRTDKAQTSLYQNIKDHRLAAKALERHAIQSMTADAKSDWEVVCKLALEILTKQSKDLEIAAWLTESLVRTHGFAGLRDGFHLIRRLIELFWNNLYPTPDEDGITTRILPITGLNGEENDGTLIAPIALIPLTESHSTGSFALWQYQQALEICKISAPEKRAQRITNGAITLEVFNKAAIETPPLFFQNLLLNINACIDEYNQLNALLKEKCEQHAPPYSRVLAQLNACLDCVSTIFSPNQTAPAMDETKTLQATHCQNTTVMGREQVLHSLLQAADFFRNTEPHSPLSYLLEKAVCWGRMSLPQLLQELIADESTFIKTCNLIGVSHGKHSSQT